MGFSRSYDHWGSSKNLEKFLAERNDFPDVVFVGYPPIEIAKVMIDYCNRNQIPALLDVKDLWPEIFVERMPACPSRRVIFYPYFVAAKTFSRATPNVGTILRLGLFVFQRQRSNQDLVVPLTLEKPRYSPELRREAKIELQRLGVPS